MWSYQFLHQTSETLKFPVGDFLAPDCEQLTEYKFILEVVVVVSDAGLRHGWSKIHAKSRVLLYYFDNFL